MIFLHNDSGELPHPTEKLCGGQGQMYAPPTAFEKQRSKNEKN